MLIRRIQSADDQAVADVIRRVMTEFGAVGEGFSIEDPEVDAMASAYAHPSAVFYVAEGQGEIVGCAGVAPLVGVEQESGICELRKMYIVPEARGQGLGLLLAETLIVDAARLGFSKIYLETMSNMLAAQQLYEKLGFVQLDGPLGQTGHCGCDLHYAMDIRPPEISPSLLR